MYWFWYCPLLDVSKRNKFNCVFLIASGYFYTFDMKIIGHNDLEIFLVEYLWNAQQLEAYLTLSSTTRIIFHLQSLKTALSEVYIYT